VMEQERHRRPCFFCQCASFESSGEAAAGLATKFAQRGHCEKKTSDTDRPGDRGAVQCGPDLFSIQGSVAFQLAFGTEERVRADVSELLYSGRGLSTNGRKETI